MIFLRNDKMMFLFRDILLLFVRNYWYKFATFIMCMWYFCVVFNLYSCIRSFWSIMGKGIDVERVCVGFK